MKDITQNVYLNNILYLSLLPIAEITKIGMLSRQQTIHTHLDHFEYRTTIEVKNLHYLIVLH